MAWVTTATLGIAGAQMLSGINQSNDVRANAQLSQSIDDLNAQYAELDAYHATQTGDAKAAQYQNTVNETIGAQKTAMAAAGVSTTFGTAGEIQADTKLTGFMNQLQMKNVAQQQAMGFNTQARNLRTQGSQAVSAAGSEANALQTSSELNAAAGVTGYFTKGLPKVKNKQLTTFDSFDQSGDAGGGNI